MASHAPMVLNNLKLANDLLLRIEAEIKQAEFAYQTRVNQLLADPKADLGQRAQAFKQALSLFVACAVATTVAIVLPVLFEGDIKAVIELASFEEFSEVHLSFLEQKGAIIGCCATGKGAGVNVGSASRKVMFPLVFTNIEV